MTVGLYPIGYQRDLVSMAELRQEHEPKMHPVFAERLFNFLTWYDLFDQDSKMGIGDGWRPTPSDTSQASREGHSFHQTQHFASGFVGYCGVDLVCKHGNGNHRAPHWDEVPKQNSGSLLISTYKVHCNVEDEPWHIQPVEIDGFDTWVHNGRKDPVGEVWTPPEDPASPYGLWPLATNKPDLRQGMRDGAVGYLQRVIRDKAGGGIAVDNYFGPQTTHRVKDMQRLFGLVVDGVVGHQTWPVVDFLASK
jgi:hypothetical protein